MRNVPWYKRAHRWCQCNLTEIDARDCDVNFWRAYWRKHDIQGTIINAGGTVAFFPSDNPYQYRAKYLGTRDLTKEFVDAAREEGLAVMARMDINRGTKELYEAKPEWFSVKADGTPYVAGPRYLTCINGGYYTEQVPKVMTEIIEKYHPDCLGDNSWKGAGAIICYCDNCKRMFKEYCGLDLPEKADYLDRTYRLWLEWSLKRRAEVFRYFNEITQKIGGEDCVWMGMINSDVYPGHGVCLYDYAELGEFGKVQMVDNQARDSFSGFEQNSVGGMSMHEVFGDDALIIQSMAQYQFSPKPMRRTYNTPVEAQIWMRAGISAGSAPSPHYIGSVQDDMRLFDICTPVLKWQRENEQYLFERRNAARVGLVWSVKNQFFHGKNNRDPVAKMPFTGMTFALTRGRIGYFPVNANHIEKKMDRLDVLILPDVAVMTDDELRQVEVFVKQGGSLVLSGGTGMLDQLGYPRTNFPLDELLGIRRKECNTLEIDMGKPLNYGTLDQYQLHAYMRLGENRHSILQGFENTDIIAIPGQYYSVRSDKLDAVAYMVPPFPIYPPEFAYMDDGKRVSDDPAILAGETGYGGRVVYLAADLDRRYGSGRLPDLGDLLVNAIRWALDGKEMFTVEGRGQLDCKLYKQPGRYIFHALNHTGLPSYPYCAEECNPVGEQQVMVRVGDLKVSSVTSRVNGGKLEFTQEGDTVRFVLSGINEHEFVVIE